MTLFSEGSRKMKAVPSVAVPDETTAHQVENSATFVDKLAAVYGRHQGILLGNLSRLNNLLIIVNISLFFLTGLVAHGYYFTFISIGCLMLVAVLLILPLPALERPGYYLACLGIEAVGLYFLVASVLYRLQHGGYASPPL